jgi:Pvc16 N-terminal domain
MDQAPRGAGAIMIGPFELMLRQALLNGAVTGLTDELQIRFEPPDQAWVDYLSHLGHHADPALGVNCCLVEVKENAQLRSNEWVHDDLDGLVIDEPPPMRVDCTYLITAWDPASLSAPIEPGLREHRLLYDVLAVLAVIQPINTSRIYPPGDPARNAVPDAIKDVDLPTRVAPAEGYTRLGEFWQSMGTQIRWRPTIELVVTLPVLIPREITGPPVHTELVGYGLGTGPVDETRLTIGVEVRRLVHRPHAPDMLVPVPGALVALERGGERFDVGVCDEEGRVVLDDVPAGSYDLHAWAPGLGDTTTPNVAVPSSGGDYRVTF